MAAVYPGALPTIASNKAEGVVVPDTDHPLHHNQLAEEITAGLTELGINPSGSDATVAARLARMEGVVLLGTAQNYTVTNHNTLRTLDKNTYTLDTLCDFVMTSKADDIARGISS